MQFNLITRYHAHLEYSSIDLQTPTCMCFNSCTIYLNKMDAKIGTLVCPMTAVQFVVTRKQENLPTMIFPK